MDRSLKRRHKKSEAGKTPEEKSNLEAKVMISEKKAPLMEKVK